jgi:GH24 family phage-related lysozyme (muramidase)
MLRYHETGELHRDFHGSMNAAVEYVGRRYGREGLRTILRATAQQVYRSIYKKLKAGDWSELAEHWRIFYGARGGGVRARRDGDVADSHCSPMPA